MAEDKESIRLASELEALKKERANLKRKLRSAIEKNDKYQKFIAHLINDQPSLNASEYSSILTPSVKSSKPSQPTVRVIPAAVRVPRAIEALATNLISENLSDSIEEELKREGVTGMLRNLKKIPVLSFPGIYFLLNNDDEVVYVGQSMDIYARIKSHTRDSEKNKLFTHFKAICCPIDELNKWEQYFITQLNPKLNKTKQNDIDDRKRKRDFKKEALKTLPKKVRGFRTETPWVHFSKVM